MRRSLEGRGRPAPRAWPDLVVEPFGAAAYGVAKESNLPSVGLPRLTGFEDRLGHRPRPLPACSAYGDRAVRTVDEAADDRAGEAVGGGDQETSRGRRVAQQPAAPFGYAAVPGREAVGVVAVAAAAARDRLVVGEEVLNAGDRGHSFRVDLGSDAARTRQRVQVAEQPEAGDV